MTERLVVKCVECGHKVRILYDEDAVPVLFCDCIDAGPPMIDEDLALCVTCGEYKPSEQFAEGDCTCEDCYEAGRSGANYALDDGDVVEKGGEQA